MLRPALRCLNLALVVCLLASQPLFAECTLDCAAVVPATGDPGSPVQFTSASEPCGCANPPTYFWTFGDGDSSSEASPSKTYAAGGTYNWNLTVTSDSTACTKSGTITISGGPPQAGTYTGTTSQGQSFSLTVNGSSQVTGWSFGYSSLCSGSGSTSTSGAACSINSGVFSCGQKTCIANGAVMFQVDGTFTSSTEVTGTLTARWQSIFGGSCCINNSTTFTASLGSSGAPLTASASGDPTSGVAPLNVSFTGNASGGTAPYTFSWRFGDCTGTSGEQNPSHNYNAGEWSATLSVSDSAGGTAQAIVPISVTSADAATLDVQAPASTVVGQGFNVTVTARDAGGNVATSYDGTVHFTSSDTSASLPADYTFQPGDSGIHDFANVTLNSPGSHSITVTDTADASINGSVNITAGYASSTSVSSSPNPSAQGGTVTLTASITATGAGSPSGSVTFYDGETNLGTSAVATQLSTLSVSLATGGPHGITAVYSGDGNYLGSTSPQHTHYVLLSAPAGVTATAASTTSVTISWNPVENAFDYEVQRSTDNAAFSHVSYTTNPSYTNTGLTQNVAYFYRVGARDTAANNGAFSASDRAVTVIFTDDPLILMATMAKAVHLTELQTAVNAMRAAAGMGAFSFTVPPVVGALIRPGPIQELRDALALALDDLGLPPINYTDPALSPGILIKGAHVSEIRNGVK